MNPCSQHPRCLDLVRHKRKSPLTPRALGFDLASRLQTCSKYPDQLETTFCSRGHLPNTLPSHHHQAHHHLAATPQTSPSTSSLWWDLLVWLVEGVQPLFAPWWDTPPSLVGSGIRETLQRGGAWVWWGGGEAKVSVGLSVAQRSGGLLASFRGTWQRNATYRKALASLGARVMHVARG